MSHDESDVLVVVDGAERELVGPMTQAQAGAFLSCLDRYRPDLSGHAVFASALPGGAELTGTEEFHVHPMLLDPPR